MAKLDFARIEQLIMKALLHLKREEIERLCEELMQQRALNVEADRETELFLPEKETVEVMIKALKKDFKRIKAGDPELYEKLKPAKKMLTEMVLDEKVTMEEWRTLNSIRRLIFTARMETAGGTAMDADEKQIEEQLRRLEKRGKFHFNVNEKWDTI